MTTNILIDQKKVAEVENLMYYCNSIDNSNDFDHKLKCRIRMATAALNWLSKMCDNKELS